MTAIPIVPHFTPDPSAALVAAIGAEATWLRRRYPQLAADEAWAALRPKGTEPGPNLSLYDQSGIVMLEGFRDVQFRQELSRFRAGVGDMVATTLRPTEGFETYCREQLGLGAVDWLVPRQPVDPLHVATSLWRDNETRERLLRATRSAGGLTLQPHKGTATVWRLAALIHVATGCPVGVVAPPPGLTAWVNDKIAFTETVERLFGARYVPKTHKAASLAEAAKLLHKLAQGTDKVVLKLPDSMGGGGNVVIDAERFRNVPPSRIVLELEDEFCDLEWNGGSLLVSEWETEVLAAPSAQLWIPADDSPPVVEGLFEQLFGDERGMFVGVRRADLSQSTEHELVDCAWVIARLYQQLGYVGRCSFDALVVDDGSPNGRLEFLECNGRWGATSIPMTLMNRLFGDWSTRPFMCREHDDVGLTDVSFPELTAGMGDDLFDVRTGRGNLIFINPARMAARGGMTTIVLAETAEKATEVAGHELPARLAGLAQAQP